MLTIRNEQLDALRAEARRRYAVRLAAHLRKGHPEAVAGMLDADVLVRVDRGIERAQAYGLTSERAVGQFVVLLFEVGPQFDTDVRVKQILLSPLQTPDLRPGLLLSSLSEADWDEIAESTGQSGW